MLDNSDSVISSKAINKAAELIDFVKEIDISFAKDELSEICKIPYQKTIGVIIQKIEKTHIKWDCSTKEIKPITIFLNENEFNGSINIIWALLHEIGHLLDKPLKTRSEAGELYREYNAWDIAEKELGNYPLLSVHKTSFDKYRLECILSYHKDWILNRKNVVFNITCVDGEKIVGSIYREDDQWFVKKSEDYVYVFDLLRIHRIEEYMPPAWF